MDASSVPVPAQKLAQTLAVIRENPGENMRPVSKLPMNPTERDLAELSRALKQTYSLLHCFGQLRHIQGMEAAFASAAEQDVVIALPHLTELLKMLSADLHAYLGERSK